MTYALGGGALALLFFGQETGAQMIDQALQGDISMGDVMDKAVKATGFGINATDAGILIAAMVLATKAIDAATKAGWLATVNDIWRKAARLDPPASPPKGS